MMLREVQLHILNKNECQKYAQPNAEQKYCSGENNVLKDTCQVYLFQIIYFKMRKKFKYRTYYQG